MLHEKIKKLISILKEEDIDEIEVRRLWTSIRVVRRRKAAGIKDGTRGVTGGEGLIEAPAGIAPEPSIDSIYETVELKPVAGGSPGDEHGLTEIVSPMVGTFYRSPNPQAEPFVTEGKMVEVGEVLCIIEAMKLMNEIEADRSGVIRKILVTDSQPVEYGQPLFLVESA